MLSFAIQHFSAVITMETKLTWPQSLMFSSHTHTAVYNSPGPLLVPIKSQWPSIKLYDCRATTGRSVPTKPICKTPGAPVPGSKQCVCHASLCLTAKQEHQCGLCRVGCLTRIGEAGSGYSGAHRKRHHPIKICSLGHIWWSQIWAKGY